MYHVSARGCGLPHQCLATAGALPSSACHCEERSDVAIRSPAVAQNEKQYLGRIRKVSRIRPKYCQLAKFPCGDADCHRCAHWFAMTCRNMRRECVCKNVGRNDIHKPGGQAHRRAKESLDKAPAPVVQWRQLNITKNGKSKAGIVHREPGHWLEARRREAPQVRPGVKGAAPLAASRP